MKYEFTGETLETPFGQLKQIKRVKDGAIGGWIQAETNLSHDGDAWVSDNAWVFGDAWVSDNARVFGDAWVSDNARVFGDARVSDNARVFGNAWVFGDARVFGNAWVFGDARVSDNARVFGNAWVFGDARVFGNAYVEKPLDFLHISGTKYNITVRNDGYASIGCQIKLIADWLLITFNQQDEIEDELEFNDMRKILVPIFEHFQQKFMESQNV